MTTRRRRPLAVSVGDPIWPAPPVVRLSRVLGGEPATVAGYPLALILAERIVTALQRGTADTRWRDFVDVTLLCRRHAVGGGELRGALERVARHRRIDLGPLGPSLAAFGDIAQACWSVWRRRQRLTDRTPERFDALLPDVLAFSEPPLGSPGFDRTWGPEAAAWR
jgi:hypothetical protein